MRSPSSFVWIWVRISNLYYSATPANFVRTCFSNILLNGWTRSRTDWNLSVVRLLLRALGYDPCFLSSPCRQIAGILLVLLSQVLQFDIDSDLVHDAKCSNSDAQAASSRPSCFNSSQPVSSAATPQDLTHAILLYVCLMVLVFIFFAIFFWPRYKRIEAEKKADFEASMFVHDNSKSRNSSTS